jgi:ketosteroid isomerase-like protein
MAGEVLNSVVEGINTGDLNSLMTLYEDDACFASQPGQHAKSQMVYAKVCVVLSTSNAN